MKIVVQRVSRAEVRVEGKTVAKIGKGLVLLAAVERGDSERELAKAADKCLNLRIFEDENGRLNLSALDLNLEILAISNFTVAGDTRKGRRPSFDKAERPEVAKEKFDRFVQLLRDSGLKVETGEFRAIMEVELVNHGPVTVIVHVPPETAAQK